MKKIFFFAVLIVFAANSFAQDIPMTKGCTWTYRITVQYMKEEQEARKTFTVKMKVIDFDSTREGFYGALITGNPQQYAFYEDSVKYNARYALIKSPSGLYFIIDVTGKNFRKLLKGDMMKLLKDETPFFSKNIEKGDVLCKPAENHCEAKYHWSCEDNKKSSRNIRTYNMKNWDNTGTETWDITSEHGFGNFYYEHNGTLSSVKAVMQHFSRK